MKLEARYELIFTMLDLLTAGSVVTCIGSRGMAIRDSCSRPQVIVTKALLLLLLLLLLLYARLAWRKRGRTHMQVEKHKGKRML